MRESRLIIASMPWSIAENWSMYTYVALSCHNQAWQSMTIHDTQYMLYADKFTRFTLKLQPSSKSWSAGCGCLKVCCSTFALLHVIISSKPVLGSSKTNLSVCNFLWFQIAAGETCPVQGFGWVWHDRHNHGTACVNSTFEAPLKLTALKIIRIAGALRTGGWKMVIVKEYGKDTTAGNGKIIQDTDDDGCFPRRTGQYQIRHWQSIAQIVAFCVAIASIVIQNRRPDNAVCHKLLELLWLSSLC